jgi:hypothetical protein
MLKFTMIEFEWKAPQTPPPLFTPPFVFVNYKKKIFNHGRWVGSFINVKKDKR